MDNSVFLEFDQQIIDYFEKKDYDNLCDLLDRRFQVNSNRNPRIIVTELSVYSLNNLLNKTTSVVTESEDENFIVITTCIFKVLRNAVALNETAHKCILEHEGILFNAHEILRSINSDGQHNHVLLIRTILQFLINLVVSNSGCSKKLWDDFGNILEDLIFDSTHSYCALALIYNIIRTNLSIALKCDKIFSFIFNSCKENGDNEYVTFLMEHFIKTEQLMCTYVNFPVEHRVLCLETLHGMYNDYSDIMSANVTTTLSNEFKQKSDHILKTVTDYLKEIEPYEVSLLLKILASISGDDSCLQRLQTDRSLLINCAFLLRSIHDLGKTCRNDFTPMDKLSDFNSHEEAVLNHPAFGFKADLIRILGNLSWKNRNNQDEMRELDCIPLLLDCCSMDARNPLITQWVVFATRNLCEDNEENQKVIASMNRQGTITSAALDQMGLTLHGDGKNEIKLIPLQK